MKKIIFVVGATATGKSQWALKLAKKYNGSIVNIDSIQFYDGLVIGSAAPTLEEKKIVPHYFYNDVEAPAELTAGEFLRRFHVLLEGKNLKFPLFVVGGTGFYIQALEKGMFDIPEVDRELKILIENEITELGTEKAFAELKAFDPDTKVHLNDAYRIGRALEVKRAFGKTMTQLQSDFESTKKFQLQLPYLKIGLLFDKEILLERVKTRTDIMLKQGIIAEVEFFVKKGFLEWAPLKSVGYFEVLKYLKGELPLQDLPALIVQSTMQLIKKQKTWFKRDDSILWSNGQNESIQQVELKIDQFLRSSAPAN